MIYRNGKKIGAVFRNGKATSQLFRNSKLVWQKGAGEAQRIKSVAVSLPKWGTVERAKWESVLRALPADIRNYSLVAVIRGVPVRLRGVGVTPTGELDGGTITLPSNIYIDSSDVQVGQAVTFTAKVPAVTSEPTYQHSNDSFQSYGYFMFKTAPFLPGSKLIVKLKPKRSFAVRASWTISASCGVTTGGSYAVQTSGAYSANLANILPQLTHEVVYSDEDYKKMVTHNTSFWQVMEPNFEIDASGILQIGPVTLESPESELSFKLKIRKIETY